MLVRIIETNEIKNLIEEDEKRFDWLPDLLKRERIKTVENDLYLMTREEYDKWKEYIVNFLKDQEELIGVAAEFNISVSAINERVNEELAQIELEKHHEVTKRILEEIRDEQAPLYARNRPKKGM